MTEQKPSSLGQKWQTLIGVIQEDGLKGLKKLIQRHTIGETGSYRPDEAKIAFEVLRGGKSKGVMIDVGAHIGSALKPYAEQGWTIYAFEPDTENRKELEELYGDRINVHIDYRALSDKVQEKATFYRNSQSTGISSLAAFHEQHKAEGFVQVTTLEQFFKEQKWTSPVIDLLKIDTEGFDLPVLKGYPWSSTKPRMIVCEFENAKTVPLGYSFKDLADYLQRQGFQLVISEWYPIERYGVKHNWRHFKTYPCELADPKGWGNIIAASEPELFKRLLEACKL